MGSQAYWFIFHIETLLINRFGELKMDDNKKIKIGEALIWNELADIYDQRTGQCARIKPMSKVFEWAEKQTDKFYVNPKEGTLHIILDR